MWAIAVASVIGGGFARLALPGFVYNLLLGVGDVSGFSHFVTFQSPSIQPSSKSTGSASLTLTRLAVIVVALQSEGRRLFLLHLILILPEAPDLPGFLAPFAGARPDNAGIDDVRHFIAIEDVHNFAQEKLVRECVIGRLDWVFCHGGHPSILSKVRRASIVAFARRMSSPGFSSDNSAARRADTKAL